MRAVYLSILLTLMISPSVLPQAAVSQSQRSDTEARVRRVNDEWFAAFRKGDAAAFDRLTAEDFLITNVNGNVRNKEQMLRNNPSPGFDSAETYNNKDVRVRVYENAAIITGGITVVAPNKSPISFRYTNVCIKHKDVWLVASSQLTRVMAQ